MLNATRNFRVKLEMFYRYRLLFVFFISSLVFSSAVNIATITVDTPQGNRISNLVSNYVRTHTGYTLLSKKKITDEGNVNEIIEAYKLFNNSNVRDVFAYLPYTDPNTLNDITTQYKIYTLNAVNHDSKICLKYTFYGFDTCHGKYLRIM